MIFRGQKSLRIPANTEGILRRNQESNEIKPPAKYAEGRGIGEQT
jgi:hypothetical protein